MYPASDFWLVDYNNRVVSSKAVRRKCRQLARAQTGVDAALDLRDLIVWFSPLDQGFE